MPSVNSFGCAAYTAICDRMTWANCGRITTSAAPADTGLSTKTIPATESGPYCLTYAATS